jgi:nitronate monooxygenase
MSSTSLPLVIQGGMGIAVSNWRLAREVSLLGQMGVVSGTAVDSVLVRRLQDGDLGGHVRRAMEAFPWQDTVSDVLKRYFEPDGRPAGVPYKLLAMYRATSARARQEVTVLANFVEVWLAKEGHTGPVGVNLLTKVQMPNLASLYGAMLAGVDYVLMGAGIPKEIPGALDRLAQHEEARLRLDVDGASASDPAEYLRFDPRESWRHGPPVEIGRPNFLPIVSAGSLALMLARKANGRVDGFVVEGPTAGGHNAPPRGSISYNERGEPVYGERDRCNMQQMRDIGLPFWLAGSAGSPEGLRHALEQGAAGIQVGTLFAYTDESGLDTELKRRVLEQAQTGEIDVVTDAIASPTGFPFKVVQLEGTNALPVMYEARERVCDLGYLRTAYRRQDGRIDYRCPAEPVDTYVKKGGDIQQTRGRKCLCNALMADIGMAQVTAEGGEERPLLTSGDELKNISLFAGDRTSYKAAEVLEYLMAGVQAQAVA